MGNAGNEAVQSTTLIIISNIQCMFNIIIFLGFLFF